MRLTATRSSITSGGGAVLDPITQEDPTLDLNFADSKALRDDVDSDNPVTFTRASSATYVDSDGIIQSATVNTPRFDHDPVTGESLGLLIEEARTNVITYSEEFADAAWEKSAVTITPNAITAPDGTLTASRVTNTADQTTLKQSISVTGTCTASAYAKYDGNTDWFRFATGAGAPSAWFNVNSGYVGIETNCTGNIESVGNGWYRASITGDFTPSTTLFLPPTSADGSGVEGNGNSLYIWGVQVEEGSSPTSYIPTVASTVTRAPDIAHINGANFSSFYNASEWTMYSEARCETGFTCSIHNNDDSKRYGLVIRVNDVASSKFFQRTLNAGGGTGDIFANPSTDVSGFVKSACTIGSSANLYSDGLAGTVVDAFEYNALAAVELAIGYRGSYLNDSFANGHIKRLAYFPVRLPDDTLQNITS